jgi:stage V sporulation protein B
MLLGDVEVLRPAITSLATEAGRTADAAETLASEIVGVYSAAQKFAFIPYQLLLSVTFVVFPMISRATSLGDAEATRRTIRGAVRFSMLVLAAIAAPIVGAASGVMHIVYPAEYAGGAATLSVLAIAMVGLALFVVAATVISGSGRPGIAASIAGVSLAVGLAGNWVFVRAIGLDGDAATASALGTASGTWLAAVLAALAVWKSFGAYAPALSVVRILVAGAAAFGVARFVPHESKMMAFAALVAGGVTFLAALAVTRELGKDEIALVRRVLGRKKG